MQGTIGDLFKVIMMKHFENQWHTKQQAKEVQRTPRRINISSIPTHVQENKNIQEDLEVVEDTSPKEIHLRITLELFQKPWKRQRNAMKYLKSWKNAKRICLEFCNHSNFPLKEKEK